MCNHPSKSPKYFQEKKKKSLKFSLGKGLGCLGKEASACLEGLCLVTEFRLSANSKEHCIQQ